VVLARSLLGATADDLTPLLQEAVAALPVPVVGVISDGQQSIRRAVAALPGVPQQLCQFHYLREAAKEVYEADRHAKTQLKKAVRGVRPIERALDGQPTAEVRAVRGYCAAVRCALMDDGRPPLCAAGLRLHERLEAIADSLGRVLAKGEDPAWCGAWRTRCAAAWRRRRATGPPCVPAYALVHQAAHLLTNEDAADRATVEARSTAHLAHMREVRAHLGTLAPAIDRFLRVRASYWPGLFHCYAVPELPRTTNEVEHFFGAAR
jgi:hypothetical protein